MDLQERFRGAMRRLAATVNIVTTEQAGQRYGMTATAVMSLTTEPASLVVAINQSASIHQPIVDAGKLCINILQHGQENISAAFSGQLEGEQRFSVGNWSTGFDGLPCLDDAQSSIFCTVQQHIPFATHSVFIALVQDILLLDEVRPLVYADGKYQPLALDSRPL